MAARFRILAKGMPRLMFRVKEMISRKLQVIQDIIRCSLAI